MNAKPVSEAERKPIRVLVPCDGSENALRALAYVTDWMAHGMAVELHLLNVQPSVRGDVAAFVPQANIEDYHREEGEKALQSARERLDRDGIAYTEHIGVGRPGRTIAGFVRDLDIHHVVMGTRGLGAAAGLLLGSVATDTIRDVGVPVTLVK